ncbi:MAG: hypothetical protein P8010_13105 [Desulfosarcinaceae bacterium]
MGGIAPETFEAVMLVCFGCSWPFAVAKTLRTRDVRGKSIVFITLIFIGYLSGILHKLMTDFDAVTWLYITNGSLVFTEMVLYYRYIGSQRPTDAFTAGSAPEQVEEYSLLS